MDFIVKSVWKVWICAKLYTAKYYFAFFCGGLVWMLLDIYVTHGIDASFVSDIMDSTMAAVAILALYKEKKYGMREVVPDI